MCVIFVVGIQKSRFWNYYTAPLNWSNNKLIRNSKLSYRTSCLVVLNLLKRRHKYLGFSRKCRYVPLLWEVQFSKSVTLFIYPLHVLRRYYIHMLYFPILKPRGKSLEFVSLIHLNKTKLQGTRFSSVNKMFKPWVIHLFWKDLHSTQYFWKKFVFKFKCTLFNTKFYLKEVTGCSKAMQVGCTGMQLCGKRVPTSVVG